MTEKFVKFADGTTVPETRAKFALQFLHDMEEQFGTDFIQAPTSQEVA